MKIRFLLTLSGLILFQSLFGQNTLGNYSPRSECENYNAFLTSTTFDNLNYYMDTIYPSGIMRFDLSKSDEYDGVEDLYSLLGVPEGCTFEFIDAIPNRLNDEKLTERYQQYYNGIKVDGGGYSISYYIKPGGGGKGPCDKLAYMLSPHISSGIKLDVKPKEETNIKLSDLGTILESEIPIKAETMITQNLLNDCQYHLVWKTEYAKNGGKISWVDANTGSIVKTIDAKIDLSVPTATYGTILNEDFDDSENGGTTSLISTDGRVSTYDFTPACPTDPLVLSEWNTALIPTTTAATDWTNEADPMVYQAHHVVTRVVPVFDEIDINFNAVNVASCTGFGAQSLRGSTTNNAFIFFGLISGSSTALFDVAGHELAHTFLNDFLDYTNPGNASLHEGIADMIGTYTESVIQEDTIDWGIGDDEVNVENLVGRDLQVPGNNFDCFTQVSTLGMADRHDRSKPLGHWFYLVSEGQNYTITGLGIEKALLIVLESLNLMSANDDYEEMRAATLAVVDDEFGPCSLEDYTVRRAWHEICVGPNDFTDCFTIEGNNYVCEEDNYLYLYIGNLTPDAGYRWYFPIEWTVQGAVGNTYEGTHLIVTGFPTYDWYPRYFNIKVYSPTLGTELTQFKRVKLIDCDGDDPTCEEFYSLKRGNSIGKRLDSENTHYGSTNHASSLKVFDATGRMLYFGVPSDFDKNLISYRGMIFLTYYDKFNKIVKSEKQILMK